ncbi:MAG TPA: ABC transporter ATP-binding protein, partial [Candidatus Obscuribacter sp.]|nr:ABC transporter ATP-binding protein [Candidatus Obscuribacter sp.]
AMLGFLPERPCYNRWMTVKQFLDYHHGLAGHPASERDAEIKRVLALVELDVDPKKRRIKELSRGMLQRIGLAQALIGKPQICFLDEPTSGMDPLGFILIRKLLLKLKEEGMTIVLNSHHLLEVERVCDRVAFIRRGKIEEVSSLADLNTIRQMLKVEWLPQADNDPSRQEKLAQLAEACQCPLLESFDCGAKFAVATNEKAAELLAGLQKENFSVYQSTFEKKELVELFLNERATDMGAEAEPDRTEQREGQK